MTAADAIRRRADTAFSRYKRLSPSNGAVPVGGAHFDEYLVWLLLDTFLRHLSGGSLDDARLAAVSAGKEAVVQWNRHGGGRVQTSRHEHLDDNDVLWWAYRTIRREQTQS